RHRPGELVRLRPSAFDDAKTPSLVCQVIGRLIHTSSQWFTVARVTATPSPALSPGTPRLRNHVWRATAGYARPRTREDVRPPRRSKDHRAGSPLGVRGVLP